MIYIYPENWVETAPTPTVALTSGQRDTVKAGMKTYVNNEDKPILIKELVEYAQSYILTNYEVHIKDEILGEIALEIQNEWHPPAEPEA
jgi:hypothetical protein